MPVVNSSPLIYLGKVEKLYLLKEIFGSLKIPAAVYHEVIIKGEEKGFKDALRVKAEVNKFLFVHKPEVDTIKSIKNSLKKLGFRLSTGEIECIALCLDTKDKVFLSDDDDAKRFAKTYGIDGKGTIYILLRSYRDCFLSRKECIEIFESIVERGFWVNAEIANLFHRTLDRLEK
jgi:predicted nucleic acid-binding protein